MSRPWFWAQVVLALFLHVPVPASGAGFQVVATTASLGALAREVAGSAPPVRVLAPPGRDLRRLEVSPAMVQALRSADLVLVLGTGQEEGWLPHALAEAKNPAVLPGRPGYFDAAQVPHRNPPALPTGQAAERPGPSPRADLDPVRLADIGRALGDRLGEMDQGHAAQYRERAIGFATKLLQRMPEWQRLTVRSAGVVLYDREPMALLDRFAVPLLGTLSPGAGEAPTGAYLADLLDTLGQGQGRVLYPGYADPKAARLVAGRLAWEALALDLDPALDADGDGYLSHISRWVEALGRVKRKAATPEKPP